MASLGELLRRWGAGLLRAPGGRARQEARTSGTGNFVVQIVGDGNSVVFGYAHLELTRYLRRRVSLQEETPSHADLLSAYRLAISLVGRETVLADFWNWMEKDRRSISVRVVTANAGAGKTRLALELCDQAVRKGWVAGFLTDQELARFRAQQNLSTWGWRRPTLIVVDYAAARARLIREWLIELADHQGEVEKPLRLLLLERHAEPGQGWWREAFGSGGGDTDAVERLLDPLLGLYELPPLVGVAEQRAVLTAILGRLGSSVRPPEPETSPDFDRRLAEVSWGGAPLFLSMAALVAHDSGFGAVLALSGPALGLTIARHEISRIDALARQRGIPEAFLKHLAAYVTLCQGLMLGELEEVIEEEKGALRYHSAGDSPEIRAALATVLPGERGKVSPILPDVIGEAVVLEALGCGESEKALSTLLRASKRSREGVVASLVHLAQDYGEARPEPVTWLARWLSELPDDLDAIDAVLTQVGERSLVLGQLAADLTERAVKVARASGNRESQARLLTNLASRFGHLGRLEPALEAIEEAVNIHRELAAVRPDAYYIPLAGSLLSLSTCLGKLGRRELALAASEEAVVFYRKLAEVQPDAFRFYLGQALSNLSNCLHAKGLLAPALAAIEGAVEIGRDLTSISDTYRPFLAISLVNLSAMFNALKLGISALAAAQEAVDLDRELAASRPDAFRPSLATALKNFSVCLSVRGRRDLALAAIEESVEILRNLASARPAAFRPELASSLHTLSGSLNSMGRVFHAAARHLKVDENGVGPALA